MYHYIKCLLVKKGRSAGVLFFMMFFPFGDKLQLFLVGKFLRSCIITRSRAAEKNKNLNSKKYEKKEKHRKTSFDFQIWHLVPVHENIS